MYILVLTFFVACQVEPIPATPVISTSTLTSCVMRQAKPTGSDGCRTASHTIDGRVYQFTDCSDFDSVLSGRWSVLETIGGGFSTFLVDGDGHLLYADCTSTGSPYCGTGDAPTPETNAYWLARWIETRKRLVIFCEGK